jgi:hypothetical protein
VLFTPPPPHADSITSANSDAPQLSRRPPTLIPCMQKPPTGPATDPPAMV